MCRSFFSTGKKSIPSAGLSEVSRCGGTVDAGHAAFLSPYLDRETLAFSLLVWRTYTFYWFLIVGGPIFLFKMGQVAHDLISQRVPWR